MCEEIKNMLAPTNQQLEKKKLEEEQKTKKGEEDEKVE